MIRQMEMTLILARMQYQSPTTGRPPTGSAGLQLPTALRKATLEPRRFIRWKPC